MKAALMLITFAGIAAPALTQTAGSEEIRMHVSTSFDLTVHAGYAQTAPLFGPAGERVWAGQHWDPQFLYPQPGRDEQGSVFTVRHGSLVAVWVTTLFDLQTRHFVYASFIPGIMVTTVDVRFNPLDSVTTNVHVVYARTALTAEGGKHVAAMSENDRRAGTEWQQAIDGYLASHHARP